jgi:hypothetical protein
MSDEHHIEPREFEPLSEGGEVRLDPDAARVRPIERLYDHPDVIWPDDPKADRAALSRQVWAVWGYSGNGVMSGDLIALAETREHADKLAREAQLYRVYDAEADALVPEWERVAVADPPLPVGVILRLDSGRPHAVLAELDGEGEGDRARGVVATWTPARDPAPDAAEVVALLRTVVQEGFVGEWLNRPLSLLDGDTPQQRLDAGDVASAILAELDARQGGSAGGQGRLRAVSGDRSNDQQLRRDLFDHDLSTAGHAARYVWPVWGYENRHNRAGFLVGVA